MTKINELDLTPLGLRLLLAAGASALAMGTAGALAQDSDDDEIDLIEEAEEVEETDDEIVVTGSRIRRSTFNSISPLQVITAEDSLDVGLVDPSAILQQSEAAAGQQIDSTFQGFVLDNGPGSETINIRGLGASRTLVLVNGRRFAPIGVEGAPTQPSINLLPGTLIDRYDILLDGASSVYGSDAVAGVVNAVLKKDFDGFEFQAFGDLNQAGAGHDFTVSGAWGKNNDRGFFGVGVEFDYQDEVTLADRSFLAGCNTHYEITEDGDIRTVDVRTALLAERDSGGLVTAPQSPCKQQGIAGRFIELGDPAFGSAYRPLPGGAASYPGLGFAESSLYSVPVDADGDGFQDVYFPFFSINGNDLERSFFSEQKQISAMTYGEYTFDGEMNVTPFFEAYYLNRDIDADSGAGQLFPIVPANNPFNICNPNAPGGVDCGLAEDGLLTNPNYIAAFQNYYNGGPGSANCFGLPPGACLPANFGLLNGPIGAIPVQPVVSVSGDRDNTDITLEQFRGVAGVRGDLPFINFGSLSDFTFEASATYSYGKGTSSRRGIRDDALALSLGFDPTIDIDGNGIADDVATNSGATLTELPGGACDVGNVANPDLLSPAVATGCVPVNLFVPSLFEGIQGNFATQAETDYLFDSRDFDTVYEQTVLNGFVQGTLLELPAGAMSGAVGVEYRIDSIDSQPDDIAANGLFFGFFSDLGAEGEKWTREGFAEVFVPILGGKPLARELNLEASARWTEDEFFGSAWTYSTKVGWRPVDPLLLKASFGTSFRAPNLRENFIRGQSSFNNGLFDPCAVPDDAATAQPGGGFVYNPLLDTRDQDVINGCLREGRDPTSVGLDPVQGPNQFTSAEITTGGNDEIGPETSESFTAGFAFEQPFFDSFDLNLNVSYYDIEIENSIIEPGSQFIVFQCFNQEGRESAFCDRLTYDGTNGLINAIDAGFVNQDKDTVTGIDYNATFGYEFDAFDQPMDFRLNFRANQLKERAQIFLADDGTPDSETFEGEFGFPEWTATTTATLDVSDYRFTWQTRFIDAVEQDADGIDEFSDAFNSQGNGFFGDTCGGPTVGDVLCRDVGFADEYYVHNASIRWRGDTMIIRAGVANVFDTKPPLVDSDEVFAISNTPIGNGYDLEGREYFFSIQKEF